MLRRPSNRMHCTKRFCSASSAPGYSSWGGEDPIWSKNSADRKYGWFPGFVPGEDSDFRQSGGAKVRKPLRSVIDRDANQRH